MTRVLGAANSSRKGVDVSTHAEAPTGFTNIVDYAGVMLNHVETLHKPGERDLAATFLTALGFEVADYDVRSATGTSYLFVHLEPRDIDRVNNIFYLSEVRAEQQALEAALDEACQERPELRRSLDAYIDKALTKPHGIPHFGIRYQSNDDLDEVLERLAAAVDGDLKGRVEVTVVRPGDPRAMSPNVVQAFVYTDVVVSGLFSLGQVYELQVQQGNRA